MADQPAPLAPQAATPCLTRSWGNMLNNAQSYLETAPWVAIFPGFMITLSVTSFNFIGDGLRDALDPQLARP